MTGRSAYGYPRQGQERYEACAGCGFDTLAVTPVVLVYPLGVLTVGEWALCARCWYSPFSEFGPGEEEHERQVGETAVYYRLCPGCGARRLRTSELMLEWPGGRRMIGQWAVCQGCRHSPRVERGRPAP